MSEWPVLPEFFGIVKRAPRGVILGVASFTKWAKCWHLES